METCSTVILITPKLLVQLNTFFFAVSGNYSNVRLEDCTDAAFLNSASL